MELKTLGFAPPLDGTPRGAGGLNRFLFTDKETQQETGYIDFGARQYDPFVPHFLGIDPLAELSRRHSPYVYTYNNPLIYTDPDGMLSQRTSGNNPINNLEPTENDPGDLQTDKGKKKGSGKETEARITPATPPAPTKTPVKTPSGNSLPSKILPFIERAFIYLLLMDWMYKDSNPHSQPVSTCTETCEDDENKYIYRAMAMMPDGKPEIPQSLDPSEVVSRQLGARTTDIRLLLNPNGTVSPGIKRQGMSSASSPVFNSIVITNSILSGKLVIFRIPTQLLFKQGLTIDVDGLYHIPQDNHVSIQPATTMSVNQYQRNILNTRNSWQIHTPPR